MAEQVQTWAREEFEHADLGDRRRTARLVAMAARLACRPHGKVTEAFDVEAERQGAYGLLENPSVLQESLADAAGRACARRSAAHSVVFVPVDGTSATLADPFGLKGFGAVGAYDVRARGLRLLSAIGVSPEGETLGVFAQRSWMRPPPRPRRRRRRSARERARHRKARTKRCWNRPTEQKETQHWIDVIEASARRCDEEAPETRCWFQLDREADAGPILTALAGCGQLWTVRATWNRRVRLPQGGTSHLRTLLRRQGWLGTFSLEVAAGPKRAARRALLLVTSAEVVLDWRDRRSERHTPLRVRVVWVQELGTCPSGEPPIEWLLLTNAPVDSFEQAQQVVFGYSLRWRIEEVHRTWKSGGCHVEETQLHSQEAVRKWATLLFTVAARIERLKTLARASPEQPASVELSSYEIRALLLLKRKQKKRTEVVPDTVPTIRQAVRWIADLGGYTGKSSGGLPGSVTIGRGFARVLAAAEVLQALENEGDPEM